MLDILHLCISFSIKTEKNNFSFTTIHRVKGPLKNVFIDNLNRIQLTKRRSKKFRTFYWYNVR